MWLPQGRIPAFEGRGSIAGAGALAPRIRAVVHATLAATAVSLALAAAADAQERPHASVAFVVQNHRASHDISRADLRRIYLGQITRWPDGRRIVVVVRPRGTAEEQIVLDRLVGMTEIDYSQWWVGAVFRGDSAAPPLVARTPEAVFRIVGSNPDAIGFVLAPLPPGGDLIVLTVDGKSPGDPGYAIAR